VDFVFCILNWDSEFGVKIAVDLPERELSAICKITGIASLAIHHDAELITFDADYLAIASASKLRVQLLSRNLP